MLRLAAFDQNASDRLVVMPGIDIEDEPALLEKDYGGAYGRFKNLSVIHLHAEDIDSLCERSMRLQCNISDGEPKYVY